MQREIEDLKKKLRRAQRKQTPSSSDVSSNDEGDASYRECSETPPSESYSYEEEHSHKRRRKSSSGRGVGTKVMKKALSQISKSSFTRGIEKVKLPRRFHQPTFPMYNGRTDPVEHVSQFKQKDGGSLSGRSLTVQSIPLQLGTKPCLHNYSVPGLLHTVGSLSP